VFAVVIIIFAAKNLQLVTISFLRLSARVALTFLAAGIYMLNMVTGSSLVALLRPRSRERSCARLAGRSAALFAVQP
jgi:hypothetical protein